MPRKSTVRIVRKVTEPLWRRDQLEMRAADAVLSVIEPKRRRSRKKPARTRSRKWSGFRSVLCPVDFSEHSRRALQYAVAVALRGKAELRVLYVNDPLLVAAAAAALHDRLLAKRSALELEEFVNATVPAKARTQLRLRSDVSIGNPSDQILKAARTRGTDLIVLGTHGLTRTDRLFMGSTTLSVLQHTTVPVLATPRSEDSSPARVPPSWPGERILVAVDLEGALDSEVENAASIARWFGSSLLLAHVVTDIAAPAWISAELSASQGRRIAEAQREMDALAVVARRLASTDVRVTCGRITDEIAALAANERASLLLTTLRDRRLWFGAKRGSISYHVLSHAVVPILALPPHWRPR